MGKDLMAKDLTVDIMEVVSPVALVEEAEEATTGQEEVEDPQDPVAIREISAGTFRGADLVEYQVETQGDRRDPEAVAEAAEVSRRRQQQHRIKTPATHH